MLVASLRGVNFGFVFCQFWAKPHHIRPCHTVAILSRETKKVCFTTPSLTPMVSTGRLGVVKQSFFGLPGQYGRRVTRANVAVKVPLGLHAKKYKNIYFRSLPTLPTANTPRSICEVPPPPPPQFLPISNNKVRVKVSVILGQSNCSRKVSNVTFHRSLVTGHHLPILQRPKTFNLANLCPKHHF